jgi:hypothetical protein
VTAPLRWFFILVIAMFAVWLAAAWLAYYSPTSLDEANAAVTEVTDYGQEQDVEGVAREDGRSEATPTEADTATGDGAAGREASLHLGGSERLTAGGLEALVRDAFPEDWEQAFWIVTCESRWDPHARSATGDTGLFQINDIHRATGGAAEGLTIEDLQDPVVNVRVARKLYDESGWYPWVCAR